MRRTHTALMAGLATLWLAGCEAPQEPPQEPPPDAAAETDTARAPDSDRSAPPPDCSLTMGWDPWEPYHFSGAGGRVQGLDVELAEAIATHAGCDLEFLQGNWASLLRLLRSGELDLLTGATRTPEREAFAWFTDPYREESFVIYVRADELGRYGDRSLESLLAEGFQLGVTQGYVYGPEIDELRGNPAYEDQFTEVAVGELNFTNLLDFRIDGFLENPFVAAAIQRRRGDTERIQPMDRVMAGGPVHMMLSRESVSGDVAEKFIDSLKSLEQDGTLQAIRNRYLE